MPQTAPMLATDDCGHNDERLTADGEIECYECGATWDGTEWQPYVDCEKNPKS